MSTPNNQQLKHFDLIVGLFVAVLITSNLASTKIVGVNGIIFDGGTVLFPLTYILGDVLTEVYGFAKARRVIWIGFMAMALTTLTLMAVQYLPAANGWDGQQSYEQILGFLPRIAVASLAAYLVGEFVNSIMLAKLKLKTKGKHLWLRTIGSTVIGQMLDTVIFAVIAFAGLLSGVELINLIITVYLLKVLLEVALTPLTYKVVNYLKSSENIDHYDTNTKFSPIKLDSK